MADETTINGKSVRGSGSTAGGPPVVTSPRDRADAMRQKYGLSARTADPDEERVFVFDGLPYSQQPRVSDAKNVYALLNEQQFAQVAGTMNRYYGEGKWSLSGGAGKAGVKGFWEEAVDIANTARRLDRTSTLSVPQAFEQIIANAKAAGLGAASTGGGGGGRAPEITKTVNLTDPGTAETLINQALQQYLGRQASDVEVKQFRKALRKAERGAPTEIDIEGTTQIRKGGFNPSTFAQEYAEGMEGAAEYQAATTFLDTFIGSLGARVDVV